MPFEYQFPDPRTADADGLLAVGGDLSVESLISAYSKGIFPWYNDNSPILWWSPDPRLVLLPDKLKVSSSLKQTIKKQIFTITIDNDFESVIRKCATVARSGQQGTWLTDDMIKAYIKLHQKGIAHSFETWQNRQLVGGLYGVSLGRAFFGESMFHTMSNASKVALYALVQWSLNNNFFLIDAQQSTDHMKSMGAEEMPRDKFLNILNESMQYPTLKGRWSLTT